MKIIVTSGNIGTPLAVELAKAGQDVALAVRSPKPNPAWEKIGLRQVPFDLADGKSMVAALSGADAYFSLTPLLPNFVEAGVGAVKAAKEAGVRRIVRSSGLGAGPGAGIGLGRLHYAVERAVEDSGIAFTILQPTNFMQNFLGFGIPETIRTQGAFYSPQGGGKVSVIDARDISAVAARVILEAGHEGKRYELTGGEALSNDEIAALFSQALGRRITHVGIPNEAANAAMASAGVPPWLVDLLSELNAAGREGYLAGIKTDVERVLKRPPHSFATFLADHLAAFAS